MNYMNFWIWRFLLLCIMLTTSYWQLVIRELAELINPKLKFMTFGDFWK